MQVTGVLAPTGTPDDEAVLADIKTAWVIAGIGHGHENVITAAEAEAGNITANAALVQFTRITPEILDSFHFHGDPDGYPVSAVLVAPWDDRSGTILRGRYLSAENPVQAVVPAEVIGDLVDRIFRIAALLDAVAVVVGAAALAAIGLALFLSWRLRAPEMATAYRLGAGQFVILRLATAEIAILLGLSGVLATVIVIAVQSRSDSIVGWVLALSA
jgi:putative ABC transport system permease protein